MATARDARKWAASDGLHGIGDSLYTPFSGRYGDDIDWDAYRVLVKYCIGDLEHDMLWLTSGVGEWWSLTMDERKQLLEVAVTEARAIVPDTVIQACTAAPSAKDTVELTLHAQEHGADIAYVQTPPMEVHGGEGVLRFFRYIADRTDLALGMFNSPSSGYVMTAAEMAAIYDGVPAVVVVKEGVMDSTQTTLALHALAPGLVIWECDTMVYETGWLEDGFVGPAQLGTSAYLFETPDDRRYTAYWQLIWDGKLREARALKKEHTPNGTQWGTTYPGRADYFTHWGEAFKLTASAIGLPIGDYPCSRPPQALLPEQAKAEIRAAAVASGLAGGASRSTAVRGSAPARVSFEVRAPLGVGIVSTTPEQLLAFYGDCLGFETLAPITFPAGTVHRLRAGGSLLRIYEPGGAAPADVPTGSFTDARGFRYMTLVVDDVQAVLDACRAFGLDVPAAPNQVAPGVFMALIHDPEGNWMELQSR